MLAQKTKIQIIRKILEKAVDQKLIFIDFLIRVFALSGDVECCLALRYEALVMREMKSSSNPWLHVPYGEWFTFAEHCLDNRFYSVAIKISGHVISLWCQSKSLCPSIASAPKDSNIAGPSTTKAPMNSNVAAGPFTSSPVVGYSRDYYLDLYEVDIKQNKLIDIGKGGPKMKREMKRPSKSRKSRWLCGNWWINEVEIAAGPIKEVEIEVNCHMNLFYKLHKSQLMTLKSGNKVVDEIVNAYLELLREREKRYFEYKNVVSHFFMPSEFMEMVKFYVQDLKKHPLNICENDVEVLIFF
ncbi:hypothetical protein POM88_044381 [Heracleum sosnowskyi]|uniref:Uncharacterized protein n=1 Tax=Heracleum sosnowskyi TaxID=360622 RepID=A0AAD8H5B5_9APIA|nr:hypothetical protein POM88_044381 [Heracleum sosnowskyi]